MNHQSPGLAAGDKSLRVDSSAAPSAPLPQIPDHELLRRVGEGAYGEVWLAKNVMGTYRAVKVVYRRNFSDDHPYEREFAGIKRFEPISRAHASQVDILHVGRNDQAGYFYYIMELADDAGENPKPEGRNPKEVQMPKSEAEPLPRPATDSGFGIPSGFGLRDSDIYVPRTLKLELHRRGRLPFEECLDLALALTTALEHLHQNGLMHRDIKPANIIFVNGQPKLADIGLVTDVDATKSFVGTEGYIPPEGPTTPQADIYSLGKVLYEAATGRDRQDFPELPTNLGIGIEPTGLVELNEVILKACASDAKHRYRGASEMHADLLLLKAGNSVKQTRRLERRLKLIKKVVYVLCVLAGLLTVQHWRAKHALESRKKRMLDEGERLSLQETTPLRNSVGKEQTRTFTNMVGHLPKDVLGLADLDMMRPQAPGAAQVSWARETLPIYIGRDANGRLSYRPSTNTWNDLAQQLAPAAETLQAIRAFLKAPPRSCNRFPDDDKVQYAPAQKKAADWLYAAFLHDLRQSRLDDALENLLASVHLCRLNQDDLGLTSQVTDSALMGRGAAATWEMLQAPDWNESQLSRMQSAWQELHILDHSASTLEAYRARAIFAFEYSHRLISSEKFATEVLPYSDESSWFGRHCSFPYWQWIGSYRDELSFLDKFQPILEKTRLLTGADPKVVSSATAAADSWIAVRKELENEIARLDARLEGEAVNAFQYTYVAYFFPKFSWAFAMLVRNETAKEMAVAAIALRRWQVRTGTLPARLDDLVPSILPRLPIDYMNGKPLHYRRTVDGGQLLYSVGDDGDNDEGDPTPIHPGSKFKEIWDGRDAVWPVPN